MMEYICGYTMEDVKKYLFERGIPLTGEVVEEFCGRVRAAFDRMRERGPAPDFGEILEGMDAEGLVPQATEWASIDGQARWMRQVQGLWFEFVGIICASEGDRGVVVTTACDLSADGIGKDELNDIVARSLPFADIGKAGSLEWLARRHGSAASFGEPGFPYEALAKIVFDDNIARNRRSYVLVGDWRHEGAELAQDIMDGRKDIVWQRAGERLGKHGERGHYVVVNLEDAREVSVVGER